VRRAGKRKTLFISEKRYSLSGMHAGESVYHAFAQECQGVIDFLNVNSAQARRCNLKMIWLTVIRGSRQTWWRCIVHSAAVGRSPMSATAGMTLRASNLESVRASRCDVDCNFSKVVTNS